MYKAIIEAHNLKEIDCEAIRVETFTNEDILLVLAKVTQSVYEFSRNHRLQSFSIKVDITEEKE